MGKVTFVLVFVILLVIAAGCLYLAYGDFPAPATKVEKVLPDTRFPR